MPEFIVVRTERYVVHAESLDDAQFVWRRFDIEGEFADDVEYLDGNSVITE